MSVYSACTHKCPDDEIKKIIAPSMYIFSASNSTLYSRGKGLPEKKIVNFAE